MGKRGPVPKNKALKVLSGKLPLTKENIQPLNQNVGFSFPEMPIHLSEREKEVWDNTIELLKPAKLLEKIDVAILAAYCSSYVRWMLCEEEINKLLKVTTRYALISEGAAGGDIVNPMVNISRRERADTIAFAAQLGMTPASRIRAQLVEKQPENPFANLKKRKNNGELDTDSNKLRGISKSQKK